jgi:Tfp pilus assembly protein FimT
MPLSKGYLLLNLLIFISIITVLIFINNKYIENNLTYTIQEKQQLIGLKKLQKLFFLAQSESINLGTKVYLCPTSDQKTCINRWNAGIMLFINSEQSIDNLNTKVLHYQNNSMFIDPLLRMKFFGGNQLTQKLTFLPNGMLINNGNFCIYNKLHKFNKSHCLYFNQAGKVYIKHQNSKHN